MLNVTKLNVKERDGRGRGTAANRRRKAAFFTVKQLQITGALISEAFST